jgi:hypothetical protein
MQGGRFGVEPEAISSDGLLEHPHPAALAETKHSRQKLAANRPAHSAGGANVFSGPATGPRPNGTRDVHGATSIDVHDGAARTTTAFSTALSGVVPWPAPSIPRNLFADILRLIAELRPPLAASTA